MAELPFRERLLMEIRKQSLPRAVVLLTSQVPVGSGVEGVGSRGHLPTAALGDVSGAGCLSKCFHCSLLALSAGTW